MLSYTPTRGVFKSLVGSNLKSHVEWWLWFLVPHTHYPMMLLVLFSFIDVRAGRHDLCPLDRFQNCGYLNSALSSHTIDAKNLISPTAILSCIYTKSLFNSLERSNSESHVEWWWWFLVSPTHHPCTLLVLFSCITGTARKHDLCPPDQLSAPCFQNCGFLNSFRLSRSNSSDRFSHPPQHSHDSARHNFYSLIPKLIFPVPCRFRIVHCFASLTTPHCPFIVFFSKTFIVMFKFLIPLFLSYRYIPYNNITPATVLLWSTWPSFFFLQPEAQILSPMLMLH